MLFRSVGIHHLKYRYPRGSGTWKLQRHYLGVSSPSEDVPPDKDLRCHARCGLSPTYSVATCCPQRHAEGSHAVEQKIMISWLLMKEAASDKIYRWKKMVWIRDAYRWCLVSSIVWLLTIFPVSALHASSGDGLHPAIHAILRQLES